MTPERLLLGNHAAATLFMVGLVWFVQVVHYPLLARVGRAGFVPYEAAHMRLTTRVVAPAMLAEAGLAVAILIAGAAPVGVSLGGLALLLVVWGSTAALQVPCHRRLERGFDADAHRRLVRSNWLRTAAWTARAPLALLPLV